MNTTEGNKNERSGKKKHYSCVRSIRNTLPKIKKIASVFQLVWYKIIFILSIRR